jgi:hypothetical protein
MKEAPSNGGDGPPGAANRRLYYDETDVESVVKNTAASVPGDHGRVAIACALARIQPNDWQRTWTQTAGWESITTDIAIVGSGDSAAPVSDGSGSETLAEMDVRERSIDGSDLVELAQFVSASIENWQRDGGADADARLVVCFDAIEELLGYHSRESLFKFLHLVGARLDAAGGRFVAFLDTEAVDEETKRILSAVFDRAGPGTSSAEASD